MYAAQGYPQSNTEIAQKARFQTRGCKGFDGDSKQRLHAGGVGWPRYQARTAINADNYDYALAA